jgi:hypothetical protein
MRKTLFSFQLFAIILKVSAQENRVEVINGLPGDAAEV